MRYFELAGLRGSVLGFGCGAVMGRVGRNDSLRAMGLAWDDGINVFDVARSYGFGAAEGVLGEFLRSGRREEAVVVTKFGIWPAPQSRLKNTLKPAVRMVRELVPRARPFIKRVAGKNVQYEQFSVATMRASLAESLRQLRTDHVDVLLLHGAPETVMAADDLVAALQDVVESGTARLVGVSSGVPVLRAMADANLGVLQSMQFTINLFDLEGLDLAGWAGERLVIGIHPFGGLAGIDQGRVLLESLAGDHTIPAAIRARLVRVDKQVLADVVLNVLLRDTGLHTLAPSMMSPANLRVNVGAVNRSQFDDAEIALLRQRLLTTVGVAPSA